jgi:hypothetical protein
VVLLIGGRRRSGHDPKMDKIARQHPWPGFRTEQAASPDPGHVIRAACRLSDGPAAAARRTGQVVMASGNSFAGGRVAQVAFPLLPTTLPSGVRRSVAAVNVSGTSKET